MPFVTIGAATDVGMKRKENQDFHAYFPPEEGYQNQKGLLISLADGMGGHAGGATASRMAIEVLMQEYYKDISDSIPESLKKSFLKANENVLAKSQTDPTCKGMGSTLTAVVLKNNRMYFAHVGDSRGYLIENNRITQFTEDHSYVASLLKAGVITPEEAEKHPESNVITRAIGIQADVQVDAPTTYNTLKKGQYILLCCDGLWGQVPNDDILNTVHQYKEPDIICKNLVAMANQNGGPDNITVVITRIDKVEIIPRLLDKCRDLVR